MGTHPLSCMRREKYKMISGVISFIMYGMERDQIINKLKASEAALRAQGVLHAALFGSVARNEQRAESDIDIMVEIAPDAKIGVFQYVGIVQYIQDLFPVHVDVANCEGLKDLVRPNAERDAIYAF